MAETVQHLGMHDVNACSVILCRAAFEVSRSMSQRLVTALEAYGFYKPLDLDAVVQVCASSRICLCAPAEITLVLCFLLCMQIPNAGITVYCVLTCRALQNQAFDVIGEFGFSKDYGATADLWNGSGARACLALKKGVHT